MPTIVVRPQLGGIVTKEAFQRSQPATAFDSFNFWPIDVKTGRLVPGTRPRFNQLESATGIVTLLEGVNGKSGSNPFNSFVAGIDGDLYYWNGSGFTAATGAQADDIDTTRMVSAAPLINQLLITRANNKPIIFDYPTGVAATVVESAGTAPSDARIAVPWQGTVWLAGRDADPQLLYAPRVGDLTDWDANADPEDQFAAFFSDTEFEGKLSGPITALMPQTSDTMIVSTLEGFLAMRGHPRQGGVIEAIGKGRYALGQGAWCRIPGDTLLILTPLGLMTLDPSPNATPAPLSKVKMPEELIGLPYTYSDPTVTMVYDNRWNQVHIFNRGTFEMGWTFDIETGSFHRISAESYPYCAFNFPDFDSEQSSGTLFGRYDGIHYMDKFATENLSAGFTLNPVLLSPDTMKKGRIDRMRVILGRDTPSSDLNGSLRMAVGIDAQDAVSKALAANFDYSVTLQNLKVNNGMCMPKVSGAAVVFNLTHVDGDVALEEIHMEVSDAGFNRGFRSEQFEADGEVTNFSEGVTDLDVTVWTGYQAATPQVAPASALTDHTHFLDLSLMDSTWWATVQSDGRDIRVSTTANVEVPTHLLFFDYANQTGVLAFKASQSTTPVALRIWVGNPDAVPPLATDPNGQYDTYDDNWIAFWAQGDTVNSTQYSATLSVDAGVTTNKVTGPFGGLQGTDFDAGTNLSMQDADFISANSLGSNTDWTFVAMAKKAAASNGTQAIMGLTVENGVNAARHQLNSVSTSSGTVIQSQMGSTQSGGTPNPAASSGNGATANAWHHMAGTVTGTAPRIAYLDGTPGSSEATATTVSGLVKFRTKPVGLDSEYLGYVSYMQVHNTVRNSAWIAFQAEMMTDQPGFWGTIPAFVQVNVPVPLTFNVAACPSGVVPVVETGTWSGYAAATPDAPASSLLNVLHLIDLSAMPASWWAAVASDGHDIRATNSNNLFVPFDLIDFDYANETGFAVVKLNQYSAGASQIRLWVGNGSAVTVSACSAYGRYATYDANVKGFWPGGSGTDRTQWLNTTAGVVAPDTDGPVGNQATDYTGTISAMADENIPTTVPYTLIAAAKITGGTQFQDQTLFSLTSANTDAACILKTTASASPARYVSRRPTGAEIIAGNNTVITAGQWWLQSAVVFGSTIRSVLVNGGGTTEATVESARVEGLTMATIGGQTLPDSTTYSLFDGELSLVQLHAVARPDDWVAYQYAMFNQTTFWNTWAWTASSSSLPQP